MTLTFDLVTEDDVAGVAALERRAFSDPWSEQSFRESLAHPSVYFACARRDERKVVGYVVAWFVADEGEIANLAVDPDMHGQGIGAMLLDAALAEAAGRAVVAMYLEVRCSNERARRLYRSRGFVEIGRRRGYYQRPPEDAIVLRRTVERDGAGPDVRV